jgi:hypothetical protein
MKWPNAAEARQPAAVDKVDDRIAVADILQGLSAPHKGPSPRLELGGTSRPAPSRDA